MWGGQCLEQRKEVPWVVGVWAQDCSGGMLLWGGGILAASVGQWEANAVLTPSKAAPPLCLLGFISVCRAPPLWQVQSHFLYNPPLSWVNLALGGGTHAGHRVVSNRRC